MVVSHRWAPSLPCTASGSLGATFFIVWLILQTTDWAARNSAGYGRTPARCKRLALLAFAAAAASREDEVIRHAREAVEIRDPSANLCSRGMRRGARGYTRIGASARSFRAWDDRLVRGLTDVFFLTPERCCGLNSQSGGRKVGPVLDRGTYVDGIALPCFDS